MPSNISSSAPLENVDSSTIPLTSERAKGVDETSLLDLLIVLAEWKRMILAITGVFAIGAIIVSLVLPPRYTATVTLLPPQQDSSMGAALASQLQNLGGLAALAGGSLGHKDPNGMYVAMFKSRTVEDAMVQHFGLMQKYHAKCPSDARRVFENNADVDGSEKDGLIHISVEDIDPRRAADIANGYIDEFRLQSRHLAFSETSQRRLFFEKQLEQAKANLANAEEAMKQTEDKTGVIQRDSQARALIELATSLRALVAAKEAQIQGMRAYATGENPQFMQAQHELDGMRTQLAKLGGSEDSASDGLIVPKGKIAEAGLEYARKLREVKYYEAIFDILARQFEAAKLDEAKQGDLIQVVDPAIPPDRKSYPKRGIIVIEATMIGFFGGVFIALFLASFRKHKRVPEDRDKIHLLWRSLSLKWPRTS
jgi:tyrosine-protein kinase Etk/Wzc